MTVTAAVAIDIIVTITVMTAMTTVIIITTIITIICMNSVKMRHFSTTVWA